MEDGVAVHLLQEDLELREHGQGGGRTARWRITSLHVWPRWLTTTKRSCRSSFQKGREVQEKMNAEAAKNSTAAEEPQPGDQTTLYTAKAAEVQKRVDGLLAQAHHEHGNSNAISGVFEQD